MHGLDALYSLGFIILFILAFSMPGIIIISFTTLFYFIWNTVGSQATNAFGESFQIIYWTFILTLAAITISYIHIKTKDKPKKLIKAPYSRKRLIR